MFTNSHRVPEIDSRKTSKKYITGGLLALTILGLSVFGGQQMGFFKGDLFSIKNSDTETYLISDDIINTGICNSIDGDIEILPNIRIMQLPNDAAHAKAIYDADSDTTFFDPIETDTDPIGETITDTECPGHYTVLSFNKNNYGSGQFDKIKVSINNDTNNSLITSNELNLANSQKQLVIISWSGYCTGTSACNNNQVKYNLELIDTASSTPIAPIKIIENKILKIGDRDLNPEFRYKDEVLDQPFSDITSNQSNTLNGIFSNIAQSVLINAKRYTYNLDNIHKQNTNFQLNINNRTIPKKVNSAIYTKYKIVKWDDTQTLDKAIEITKSEEIQKIDSSGSLNIEWNKLCNNKPCPVLSGNEKYYLILEATNSNLEDIIVNYLEFESISDFKELVDADPSIFDTLETCLNTESDPNSCNTENAFGIDLKFTTGAMYLLTNTILNLLSDQFYTYIFPIDLTQPNLGEITAPQTININQILTINLGDESNYEGPAKVEFNTTSSACIIEGNITNKVFTSTNAVSTNCSILPTSVSKFKLTHLMSSDTNQLYKPNPEFIIFNANIMTPTAFTVTLTTNPTLGSRTTFNAGTEEVTLIATTNQPAVCKWSATNFTTTNTFANVGSNQILIAKTGTTTSNTVHEVKVQDLTSTNPETLYVQCETLAAPNTLSNISSFNFRVEATNLFDLDVADEAKLGTKIKFEVDFEDYDFPLAFVQITDGPNNYKKTIGLVCDDDSDNEYVTEICEEIEQDTDTLDGPTEKTFTWDSALADSEGVKTKTGTYEYKVYAQTEEGLIEEVSGEIELTSNGSTSGSSGSRRGSAGFQPKKSCEEYFIDMEPTDKNCLEAAFLREEGIFLGQETDEGRIANLTAKLGRNEYFTITARLLGETDYLIDTNYLLSFSDITTTTLRDQRNEWWLGPISALKGIIRGYGDGSLKPYAKASQAELAKVAAETLVPGFKNNDQREPWFQDTVEVYQDYGIRLNPTAIASRSDAVSILYYSILINQGALK